MNMTFYFTTDEDGTKSMFSDKPERLDDCWYGHSWDIVLQEEVPQFSEVKEAILKQTWNDEPLRYNVEFNITDIKKL